MSQFHQSTSGSTAASPAVTRICMLGADPANRNLGVSALLLSTLAAVADRCPDPDTTVFDFGRGVRNSSAKLPNREIPLRLIGANDSRRFHQSDTLWNIRVRNWFGGMGNPAASAIRKANAVLDISAGDSFTDLYGWPRYRRIFMPKLIALEAGSPLVLLPQTYGPFGSLGASAIARRIVRGATMAWARDALSFDILKNLLGDAFDPGKHRCGVDVAFGLPTARPLDPATLPAVTWLEDRTTPIVGFNVSGLIYNDPAAARSQYGLRADYRKVVLGFLQQILSNTDARILLVPHVLAADSSVESDPAAAVAVIKELAAESSDRVLMLKGDYGACEVKWIISRCDWFCGTRMHATIAALSSGVPAAAVSYSDKTLGVFETCGMGEHVHDPRVTDTAELIGRLVGSYERRNESRRMMGPKLDEVRQVARDQADQIVRLIGRPNCQVARGAEVPQP